MTAGSTRRRKRAASIEEQVERMIEQDRREQAAREKRVESLFTAMGVERPNEHRRAADDFLHMLEHDPATVARAMARRALELVDRADAPASVRAISCMTASQMLAESVPDERELAADLMRRAYALDPRLRAEEAARLDRARARAMGSQPPGTAPTVGQPSRHSPPRRSSPRKSRVEIALERADELLKDVPRNVTHKKTPPP